MDLQRIRLLLLLAALACGGAESNMERGQAALAAGDFPTAESEFTEALTRSPNRSDAWLARAQTRLGAKNDDGALSDLRRAAALDPANVTAWRLLGEHETAAADRRGAWDKVVELAPDDLDARRARAKERLATRDAKGAEEDLRVLLQADSRDGESHALLGEALLAQDQPYAALDEFEKGLAPSAKVPRAMHIIKARARKGDGEALSFLIRRGETADDYLDLSRALYEGGRLQPAVEEVRKAVAVHKEPDLARAQALSLSATIRLALLDDPTFAATRGATGALERGRVLEDVVRECEESLEIAPSADCYRTIGQARAEMGQPARAVQAFTQAIEVDPGDARSRRLRSAAAQERDRWDLVLEDVDALEADGQLDVTLLIRRGWAKAAVETFTDEDARADFDLAVEMAATRSAKSPDTYEALKARGFFLAEHGERDAAIADLEKARSLRPMRDAKLEERLAALGVTPR